MKVELHGAAISGTAPNPRWYVYLDNRPAGYVRQQRGSWLAAPEWAGNYLPITSGHPTREAAVAALVRAVSE